jgi:putative thioredoxin
MSIEVQNFGEDVLEASRDIPVLVDFWAPWCGPCRVLGPVLETIAARDAGRFKLVKVNTDEHQQLSLQYGIRGIPAVKLFVDGEVVAEFTGALPEYAVEKWLDDALPSETRRRLEEAEQRIASGDRSSARAILSEVLDADGRNPRASALLARLLLFDDPVRAQELAEVALHGEPDDVRTAEVVTSLGRLLQLQPPYAELDEGPGRADYVRAIDALREGDMDAALQSFIEVIQKDRYYDDDGSRKACIGIFELLGRDSETTRRHRRMFDMVLY